MNGAGTPWLRRAARAVWCEFVWKAIGIPASIGLFFAAYFYLLRHPAFAVTVMPLTALDRAVGFQSLALPLYLSIWVYVSLPPALLTTTRALRAYAADIGLTCLAGLFVFFFWPTTVPVGDIDWALSPAVGMLKNLDAAGNACPSLHVATAAFSCLWLHRILRRLDAPRAVRAVNIAWCAGIAYSTLATRQHVALDVLAGLALGIAGAAISLRRRA